MLIRDKVSHSAVTEAYCLLTAYIREEKIAASYKKEDLQEFATFLAEILRHPENFNGSEPKVNLADDQIGHA